MRALDIAPSVATADGTYTWDIPANRSLRLPYSLPERIPFDISDMSFVIENRLR